MYVIGLELEPAKARKETIVALVSAYEGIKSLAIILRIKSNLTRIVRYN